jgi:hypothetical protein
MRKSPVSVEPDILPKAKLLAKPTAKPKMDAGLRRHDKSSLRLKPALSKVEGAREFNHPREGD